MTSATEAAAESIGSKNRGGRLRIPRMAAAPTREFLAAIEAGPDARAEKQRHALNVIIALGLFVLLLPLMALIALAIKLTSPGPVIYKQTRVGLDRRRGETVGSDPRRLVDYGGRLFTMYKFRTMTADPNANLQIWAKPNDARVTRLGRVLRSLRLDELPQLINVIRGDMNIVGPRPEQPNIFLTLRDSVNRYQERQQVLPGITGWAQINQHYDRCIDDVRRKVEYDLEYIKRSSIAEDIRILLQTLPVMVFKKGAL